MFKLSEPTPFAPDPASGFGCGMESAVPFCRSSVVVLQVSSAKRGRPCDDMCVCVCVCAYVCVCVQRQPPVGPSGGGGASSAVGGDGVW